MYPSWKRNSGRSSSRLPVCMSPIRSLSPISPSVKLLRAWSRERLPLTAAQQPQACSPESGIPRNLTTPKCRRLEEAESSSPRTPDSKLCAADRLIVHSEYRSQTSPSTVDLLLNNIQERRRTNANYSPLRESPLDSELFPQSQVERQLAIVEGKANDCVSGITVKLLRLLNDITIAPKLLEKTLFSLLTLCAEVDASVEVGSNCKVMASRVWPAVKRYFQSQGQVVQTIRKLVPSIKCGKVPKRTIARASEMVSGVSENRLKAERGGHIGVVVLKLVRSVVDFARVWERLSEKGRREKALSDIRLSVTRSSLTPRASIVPVDDPKPRLLQPPDIPSSPIEFSPESKPFSDAQTRRKQSLLETTLNWELEFILRKLIMEKIATEKGSTEVVQKDTLVEEFATVIEKNASIRGSLDGPDGNLSRETVSRFCQALASGSLYDLEVQRAVKLRKLETRMEEVGRTYELLAKEKERLEHEISSLPVAPCSD